MTTQPVFDKASYAPTDTIHFQVVTTEPMTATVDFTGSVELPSGATLGVTAPATITGSYGAFSGPGYDVTQSDTDPSQYTAVPTGS